MPLETLFERIEADKRVDPQVQKREAFYAFTCNYWLHNHTSTRDHQFGVLLAIDGVPEELKEVDRFKPGLQMTTVSLDTSRVRQECFTWHVNSYGRYLRVMRQLTISDYGIEAAVDYQRLVPDLGGTTRELEPSKDNAAFAAFMDVTRNLVQQTLVTTERQTPLLLRPIV